MLTEIEYMKYFLRTAYKNSKEYVGSTIEVKFQGLCQGNGEAPSGWAVISITSINANKREDDVCAVTVTNLLKSTALIPIKSLLKSTPKNPKHSCNIVTIFCLEVLI